MGSAPHNSKYPLHKIWCANAKKVIKWALEKGDKLLFFPDQHLGYL